MTFGRASAFVGGFLGAVVLGAWIGPHVTNRGTIAEMIATVTPAAGDARAAEKTAASRAATPRATTAVISLSPELHKRLKPLLNQGADMSVASEGFRDAEHFATLAHAARNTEIPFMVLKHRVISEGKTLVAAIRTSKPDLNAAIEANRARAEAKADLAAADSEIASTLGG